MFIRVSTGSLFCISCLLLGDARPESDGRGAGGRWKDRSISEASITAPSSWLLSSSFEMTPTGMGVISSSSYSSSKKESSIPSNCQDILSLMLSTVTSSSLSYNETSSTWMSRILSNSLSSNCRLVSCDVPFLAFACLDVTLCH